jgi:Protein of unknown function (DUF2778)
MRLLSVPIGIAALLVALAVGLVAGLWGRGGPTTDRLLTQAASLSAVPTPRGDSLPRAANTTGFMQRFVGVVDFARSDDSVVIEAATDEAAAPALTRSIMPTHRTAAAQPAASMQLASLDPAPQASPTLADTDEHTAIYDIAAHTVYLPDGRKLEAHSGIGHRLDDPHYVDAKNRGPTPPNVYQLTLREHSFHGVRALRLIPVGDAKMFGRDGILAHSYMLGPNGQSNGCVAVRNYPALLHAYLSGEVDRLVVVDHLTTHNRNFASLM